MDIFRLATSEDCTDIAKMTASADAGLTTVPRTKEGVADYIDQSERFLANDDTANRVLFVVERDGKIMGMSGIIPKLGLERPFYSFKRSRHARRSSVRDLRVKYDTLQLTTDFDDYTELASIFVAPEARGKGVSRLLSLGRLGFIETHRDLFEDRLMADIRGWVDQDGKSPFWDHLTSKFIQTDYDIADRLSAIDGRFIPELMPSLPVMLNLLPDSVNHCAGRPHELSAGAMGLLMSAGFETTDLCDIFDGGPAIECKADNTIIARTKFKPETFNCDSSDQKFLHFGGSLSAYRASIGPAYTPSKTASGEITKAIGENIWVSLAEDRRAER